MKKWTEHELELAFVLYCQTPFGKIHSRNPIVKKFAEYLDRSPSSIAMKMLNFASLDPEIVNSGRKGLGNASNKDREIWDRFHQDWDELATRNELIIQQYIAEDDSVELHNFEAESKQVTIKSRTKQNFFRKSILANYESTCCMSGLKEPRLLIASHIIPWSKNRENRLNPKNGLCLSALHDKAFDVGLITVAPSYEIRVSKSLRDTVSDMFSQQVLLSLEGNKIRFPTKFIPDAEFLRFHNEHIFLR